MGRNNSRANAGLVTSRISVLVGTELPRMMEEYSTHPYIRPLRDGTLLFPHFHESIGPYIRPPRDGTTSASETP